MAITDPVLPGCAIHGVPFGQYCYICPQMIPQTARPYPSWWQAAQPGWQCPACGHVMAPFMTSCPWCPVPAADDAPVLKVPAHMSLENANQIVRLGAGWNEVFPGLQCAIFLPTDDDGNVVAHFRLTPEDGDEPADG